MFKRLMSLGLLCLSFEAHASIIVTTTADENGENTSACSLREAIAITNSSDVTKGFGGCVNTDSSTAIILKANTTYSVNSELQIANKVTIQSASTGDINNTIGFDNPTIKAVGSHRIFSINPNGVPAATVPTVSITNVNLGGCGSSSAFCDSQGGVILNQGLLSLTSLRISDGVATKGGAIYNLNIGMVKAATVELRNNSAEQGAALYSESPAYQITDSLIRDNKIVKVNALSPGFTVYTEAIDTTVTAIIAGVRDSTLYNNSANAINIVPGIIVNNATIIGNHGGVTLNAPPSITSPTSIAVSALSNSIIGRNGADCTFALGDRTPINNIVYTNTCGSPTGTIINSKLLSDTGPETLIAADVSGNGSGVCALPPADGLLCPFRTYSGEFTGYLLPRLVPALNATLKDAPIVNKGNNTSTGQVCGGADQRGKARVLCDIGAIELVIPAGNSQTNGQDIVFGQVASIDLSPVVGDGQLIPASLCSSLYGPAPASQGGAWLDGCIVYIAPPLKGTVNFDATSNILTYKPSSNYHGFDKFSYNMTTTTSFFSEAQNNKTITLTTTIVQAPPAGITSKTVGAGSVGIFGVFALMGLAMRRRLTGGQS